MAWCSTGPGELRGEFADFGSTKEPGLELQLETVRVAKKGAYDDDMKKR